MDLINLVGLLMLAAIGFIVGFFAGIVTAKSMDEQEEGEECDSGTIKQSDSSQQPNCSDSGENAAQ